MYAYFKGILEYKNYDSVIIEVNGIGYNILMPPSKIIIMPEIGAEVRVFTYTSVREDAIELFGFTSENDLKLFKKLISVSGVGPRGALNMLSSLNTDDIVGAIVSGDSKTLSTAQGIGKKTAERIIIDLKDKLDFNDYSVGSDFTTTNSVSNMTKEQSEAVEALTALGYGKNEAKEAVIKASNDDENASDILKNALKYL